MKKILFALIVTTVLFGCSSDDNSVSGGSNRFNPPNWIHGTWLDMSESGYKFTSNNVCQITSFNQLCFKEMVDNYNAIGTVEVSVDEEINQMRNTSFLIPLQE